MLFLLRCDHCKNQMKYESRKAILGDNSKVCVFCGRSFKVRQNIVKTLK